eukprot:1148541-Pelagomonas_calceolata.AAC.3
MRHTFDGESTWHFVQNVHKEVPLSQHTWDLQIIAVCNTAARIHLNIVTQLGYRAWLEKKRKVYAGHRPRALRKGPLTSKLAMASPEVPQKYASYS